MALADELLGAFRWIDGHADVSGWYADAALFAGVVGALAEPFREQGITEVAGIESRGYLVAGAVARELGAGVVPIRKRGAIVAGPTLSRTTAPDYRGRTLEFVLARDVLSAQDRVLIVDDWLETGSQMRVAVALVAHTGAHLAGISVIVDDSAPGGTPWVPDLHSIISAQRLGPSS